MSIPIEQRSPWDSPATAKAKATENLAAALARVMAEHAVNYTTGPPELLRDRDVRQIFFPGISRSHFWELTKQAGFPAAIKVSPHITMRRRADIERWLADREQAA
jgi:predicted DNA-binding transcriptional regulator AlpA